MSVVVMILALLAAAALRYAATTQDAKYVAITNTRLDDIETALMRYRIAFGRLPCPADLSQAETPSPPPPPINFGLEQDTSLPGSGKCSGATFYSGYVVAGAVPTRTLGIADSNSYDAWNRKMLYVVDARMTMQNAFLVYPVTTTGASNPGAITIETSTSGGSVIASNAIYALVSFGEDGHGGWARNMTSAIPVTTGRYNAGSNNLDEQKNCHCDGSASTGTFDATFVQQPKTNSGSGDMSKNFDDIVRFKTRAEMATSAEMQ